MKSSTRSASDLDRIAQRAYEIWHAEGQPRGKELEHWLRAESEVKTHFATPQPAQARTSRRSGLVSVGGASRNSEWAPW